MNNEVGSKLRGQIAEHSVPAYKVAAEASMHPATLSQLLNGHLPLSEETASRIRAAIDRVGRREGRAR
jgi:DNA-binding LacI/PurR family transcriptional regulator